MSVCLAVDTVTATGSVALAVDDIVVAEAVCGDRQHAARLLPIILDCLEHANVRLAEVDAVLVADGPGSFTGIRIGFATVAGLVAHLTPEVYVAPSLQALAVAAAADSAGSVVAMYNALRGEVYAACYRVRDGEIHTVYPPHVTTVQSLSARGDVPVCAVGDGSLAFSAEVTAWIGSAPLDMPPRARHLIALRRFSGGLRAIGDLASFEPDYGRKAEAQVRWERKHGRRLSNSTGAA